MSVTENNSDVDPYWQVDLGITVPVKELIIVGQNNPALVATLGPGYSVRVGDDPNPRVNPLCNLTPFDATNGREQTCNLLGRFVTVVKKGTD